MQKEVGTKNPGDNHPQTSDISRILVGHKIVYHCDVVGAS